MGAVCYKQATPSGVAGEHAAERGDAYKVPASGPAPLAILTSRSRLQDCFRTVNTPLPYRRTSANFAEVRR